jgi:hypothetical protein
MAQATLAENLYLAGVLVAFAAFALTLFSVHIWLNLPRRPARVRAPEPAVLSSSARLALD